MIQIKKFLFHSFGEKYLLKMRQFHFGIVHVQSSGSRGNILKEEEENRWKIFD
jgi:hypothetical protein